MKNLRHVFYTLCILAPFHAESASQFSKISIKPTISFSMNKRSLRGITEQALEVGTATDPIFSEANNWPLDKPVSFEDRAFMFVADPFGHLSILTDTGQWNKLENPSGTPILQEAWKNSAVGAPGIVYIETDAPGMGWFEGSKWQQVVAETNIEGVDPEDVSAVWLEAIVNYESKGFTPGSDLYAENRYGFNNEWRLKKAGTNSLATEDYAQPGSNIIFVGDNKDANSVSNQTGRYRIPALNLGEASTVQGVDGTVLQLYSVTFDLLTDKATSTSNLTVGASVFTLEQSANYSGYPYTSTDPNESSATNYEAFTQATSNNTQIKITPQKYDSGTGNSRVCAAQGCGTDIVPKPKTYVTPSDYEYGSGTKKYYGILIAAPDQAEAFHTNGGSSESWDLSPTTGMGWENNFKRLQETPILALKNGSEKYTQTDYEHIDYYGIDLEVSIDYELADFLHIVGKTSVSAPVEKIEHTGKFIALKPEATAAFRAGLTIGNSNASIGLLYGFAYDRYKTKVKAFELVGSDVDKIGVYDSDDTTNNIYKHIGINTYNKTIEDIVTNREIIANIRITDTIDAYFSTVLSDQKYNVDVPGLTNSIGLTQKYALGISLNY